METDILAAVQSGRFVSVDAAMIEAANLLLQQLHQMRPAADAGGVEPTSKPIWEIIEEEHRSIPPEVWNDLPTDLSAQHDHYLYGTPNRADA